MGVNVKRFLVGCSILLLMGLNKTNVSAESATVTFSTKNKEVKVGDEVSVVFTVQGTATVKGVNAVITYDSRMLSYLSGGRYVSGDSGTLHIQTDTLDGDDKTRKFSMKFTAIAPGGCSIAAQDGIIVMDGEGKQMSVSSGQLSITITGNKENKDNEAQESKDPSAEGGTQEPTAALSSNNNLKSLKIHTGSLEPSFQTDVTEYKATVDNKTVDLFISARAMDSDAIVKVEGNEGLKEGNNKVKVMVKAPNGSKKTYRLTVKRESVEETKKRLEKEEGGSILEFHVYENEGRVFLENTYRFEIVDVEDETLVPAGFAETNVVLYGVNVTAYTMEYDLDNDFLLIYVLNENGDKNFYQYDRVEKTLQRYSGDLIQKVNQNAMQSKQKSTDEYNSNLTQLAIIIAVISALCIFLLIMMIKMAIKMKGIQDYDDLNLK